MTQPSLLDVVTRVDKPRKRVRQVSKQIYAELRDTDRLSFRAAQVLRCLAALYNRTTVWPTAAELTREMFRRGEIPRESTNIVAPRLTDFLHAHVIETLPKRRCTVTTKPAHPLRIREVGSGEPR